MVAVNWDLGVVTWERARWGSHKHVTLAYASVIYIYSSEDVALSPPSSCIYIIRIE